MRVTLIAQTCIDWDALEDLTEGTAFGSEARDEIDVTDADHLAEFAGRSCYKAYDRKRPETAQTDGYLENIIRSAHGSVFEHGSVTFYVQGVSRSLLLELERHRFLSYSVESQRYVDQAKSHPDPVIPPALRGTDMEEWLREAYDNALWIYRETVTRLTAQGLGIKQAREAARAFLPNATPVDLVLTANIRAWRDVLGKRYHMAADAEIREFATEVLGHLYDVAPYSVQDFPEEPFGYAD